MGHRESETHAVFKDIQVIYPPQLSPNILHGNLMPCISIYRIVYGQNVYVTMDADGSSAHYRTEEGDFAFCTIEEIPRIGRHRVVFLVLEVGGTGKGPGCVGLTLRFESRSEKSHGCLHLLSLSDARVESASEITLGIAAEIDSVTPKKRIGGT